MARELFVDTSGFYTLLVKRDKHHAQASRILDESRKARRKFVTTDYVLDETATLLKARGKSHLVQVLFATVSSSQACRVQWMDATRFAEAQIFFLKHLDHDWSFTDCASFQVMKQARLREALTKDHHFEEAGFVPLLTG